MEIKHPEIRHPAALSIVREVFTIGPRPSGGIGFWPASQHGILRTLTAALRPRGVEGEAAPVPAEAARAGLGRQRIRLARVRLLRLRPEADPVQRGRAGGHLSDARSWLSLRPRRLVDRADRLREARRLAPALGDPRPGGRLDAAQLPLLAADRRSALLAATG